MKKLAVIFIAILFLPIFIPVNNVNSNGESETTFLFFSTVKTDGNGFAYPFKTHFIMFSSARWVLWYYEDGKTTIRYLTQPTTLEGKQFGLAYVIFGIWKSPRLISQPGNISANMLVLFGIITKIGE